MTDENVVPAFPRDVLQPGQTQRPSKKLLRKPCGSRIEVAQETGQPPGSIESVRVNLPTAAKLAVAAPSASRKVVAPNPGEPAFVSQSEKDLRVKGAPPFDGLEEVPPSQVLKISKLSIQSAAEFTLVNQDENAVRASCPEVWKHESLEKVRIERIGRKERYRVPRFSKEVTWISSLHRLLEAIQGTIENDLTFFGKARFRNQTELTQPANRLGQAGCCSARRKVAQSHPPVFLRPEQCHVPPWILSEPRQGDLRMLGHCQGHKFPNRLGQRRIPVH